MKRCKQVSNKKSRKTKMIFMNTRNRSRLPSKSEKTSELPESRDGKLEVRMPENSREDDRIVRRS
jgi:hypothetical protein